MDTCFSLFHLRRGNSLAYWGALPLLTCKKHTFNGFKSNVTLRWSFNTATSCVYMPSWYVGYISKGQRSPTKTKCQTSLKTPGWQP